MRAQRGPPLQPFAEPRKKRGSYREWSALRAACPAAMPVAGVESERQSHRRRSVTTCPRSSGQLAGLGQRDESAAAEPEPAGPAADDEPLHPTARTGRVDVEAQPITVCVAPGLGGGATEGGGERLVGVAALALGRSGFLRQASWHLRRPFWYRGVVHPVPICFLNAAKVPGRISMVKSAGPTLVGDFAGDFAGSTETRPEGESQQSPSGLPFGGA